MGGMSHLVCAKACNSERDGMVPENSYLSIASDIVHSERCGIEGPW